MEKCNLEFNLYGNRNYSQITNIRSRINLKQIFKLIQSQMNNDRKLDVKQSKLIPIFQLFGISILFILIKIRTIVLKICIK